MFGMAVVRLEFVRKRGHRYSAAIITRDLDGCADERAVRELVHDRVCGVLPMEGK